MSGFSFDATMYANDSDGSSFNRRGADGVPTGGSSTTTSFGSGRELEAVVNANTPDDKLIDDLLRYPLPYPLPPLRANHHQSVGGESLGSRDTSQGGGGDEEGGLLLGVAGDNEGQQPGDQESTSGLAAGDSSANHPADAAREQDTAAIANEQGGQDARHMEVEQVHATSQGHVNTDYGNNAGQQRVQNSSTGLMMNDASFTTTPPTGVAVAFHHPLQNNSNQNSSAQQQQQQAYAHHHHVGTAPPPAQVNPGTHPNGAAQGVSHRTVNDTSHYGQSVAPAAVAAPYVAQGQAPSVAAAAPDVAQGQAPPSQAPPVAAAAPFVAHGQDPPSQDRLPPNGAPSGTAPVLRNQGSASEGNIAPAGADAANGNSTVNARPSAWGKLSYEEIMKCCQPRKKYYHFFCKCTCAAMENDNETFRRWFTEFILDKILEEGKCTFSESKTVRGLLKFLRNAAGERTFIIWAMDGRGNVTKEVFLKAKYEAITEDIVKVQKMLKNILVKEVSYLKDALELLRKSPNTSAEVKAAFDRLATSPRDPTSKDIVKSGLMRIKKDVPKHDKVKEALKRIQRAQNEQVQPLLKSFPGLKLEPGSTDSASSADSRRKKRPRTNMDDREPSQPSGSSTGDSPPDQSGNDGSGTTASFTEEGARNSPSPKRMTSKDRKKLLKKAKKIVIRFKKRYDKSSFIDGLNALYQDWEESKMSKSEWARKLYEDFADNEGDKRANRLNEQRKKALELIYELVDAWDNWFDERDRPYDIFEEAVIKVFERRRFEDILGICLVMDRAQALFKMKNRAATDGPCISRGMPWYCKYHLTEYKGQKDPVFETLCPREFKEFQEYFDQYEGYKGADKSTMNRRLYRVLFNPTLGFQNKPFFRELSMPVEAP